MGLIIDEEKLKHYKEEEKVENKYTILIVDDEPANIESITRVLGEKYNIIKAGNGTEALALLRKESNPSRINLIISDQRMPQMTGIEFLKQTIPITPKTVRIILTGYIDVNAIIDAINEGHIYKFLTKPLDSNELMVTVKRALEAYELEMQNFKLIEQLNHANETLEKNVEERTSQLQNSIKVLEKQKEELEYLVRFKDKLVNELHCLSDTDSLTGIANRRRMNEFIEMEWKRAIREKKVISLIMMDIDYFKLYNDNYGHAKGDDCLINIARIIHQQIKRPSDLATRYGGEEFCCVLPETNLNGAIKIAKNIFKAINTTAIPHEYSSICPYVTLSFGVHSMLPSENTSWQELLNHTDNYMYQAKNNGRNRIYCMNGKVEE